MAKTLLEMRQITKTFGATRALSDVNFTVVQGEIHALVGENGAGKSTLMNILSGVYPYGSYTGSILYDGQECRFRQINDSQKQGIVIIHQELALLPNLSIAENIFIGNEQAKKGVINWHDTYKKAKDVLQTVHLSDSPNTLVANIGVGKQQLVEIAKALVKNVRLLILDEPTAALNDDESRKLLELLRTLKAGGMTCILISHKLSEVTSVADQITVIRDGQTIETLDKARDDISVERIVRGMVGRELKDMYPKRDSKIGEVVLEVKNWTVYHPQNTDRCMIRDVSFTVRKGEVVGFAGLMGAGRTELAMSIFGRAYGKKISGTILKGGKQLVLKNVSDAIENGIAYATEDRKQYGLILIDNIKNNITLPNLRTLSRRGVINQGNEVLSAGEHRKRMTIKCQSIDQAVGSLSGGNQQKVVLSKWVMANPDVLILDEPTRGIDVGAKYEIYQVINQLVAQGKALIVISSELPELLGVCDRIYVVVDGEIVGELSKEEAAQETIMHLIMTHGQTAAMKERVTS